MSKLLKKIRNLALLVALIFISACGGGGGESPIIPNQPDSSSISDSSIPSCSNYSSLKIPSFAHLLKMN